MTMALILIVFVILVGLLLGFMFLGQEHQE